MRPKNEPDEDLDEDDDTITESTEDRTKDWSELVYIQKQLGDLYPLVEKGLREKSDQNHEY